VLLAEDNEVNRLVAEKMLQSLGVAVDLAVNGREALEIWSQGDFDIVFMDCQMPEMDGFEATRRIRARETDQGHRASRHHTPIVALTANALSGDREHCLAVGMDDYLAKPFTRGALQRVIRRWLPAATPKPAESGAPTRWSSSPDRPWA
jgi:CheY-like chemotaxis protein